MEFDLVGYVHEPMSDVYIL